MASIFESIFASNKNTNPNLESLFNKKSHRNPNTNDIIDAIKLSNNEKTIENESSKVNIIETTRRKTNKKKKFDEETESRTVFVGNIPKETKKEVSKS